MFGFCDDYEVLGVAPSAGGGVVGSVAGCHEELAFAGFVFEVPSGGQFGLGDVRDDLGYCPFGEDAVSVCGVHVVSEFAGGDCAHGCGGAVVPVHVSDHHCGAFVGG